jgi:two-component system, response regulator
MTVEKTVLLVDDSADDIDLMLYAFEEISFPHKIVTARDGQEAIEYLWGRGKYAGRDCRHTPILVILDLKMPRMSGMEVLRKLRSDQRLKYLTVMILTSSDEEMDKTEALKLGVNLYVRKPINFDQFLSVAKRVGNLVSAVDSPVPIFCR